MTSGRRLNTTHDTIVYENRPLMDPDIIHTIMGPKDYELDKEVYYYKEKDLRPELLSLRDKTSDFLKSEGFQHNKDVWYMDLVRYQLNTAVPVDSGLFWHYENMNYPDLITVLCYVRKDETIMNGNLRYKDKDEKNKVITVSSGTTVIMDGRVFHKPEDPYGYGKRDLVIVSFQIH